MVEDTKYILHDGTEPNAYEKWEEYVKQVEGKQSDDIFAEDEKNVDVISKLIYYGVKTLFMWKWWSS